MVTPSTCPQCGTPAQSGATICTACGHQLDQPAPSAAADAPAASPPPSDPADSPAAERPAPAAAPLAATSIDIQKMFRDTRDRWGIGETPVFFAALGLAAMAFLIGTLGAFSYLSADPQETLQKFDAAVWLQLAAGAAIGAAALLVLERWRSIAVTGGASKMDMQVGIFISVLVILFLFAAIFKGQNDSEDAVSAWIAYARVFAFLAVAWFAISRPLPLQVAGVPSTVIGLGVVAAGCLLLLFGTLQGRSETYSTYVSGLAFQGSGLVLMILALGWFLGLQPRRGSS